MLNRNTPYAVRCGKQEKALNLPLFPTTTIGSYPQTEAIRKARREYRKGELSPAAYETFLKRTIQEVVEQQEKLGLDVLVHGEPERTDMVEYFGQQLEGFCFTEHGWVQSYGSRCVKPPILYGDVSRKHPMTVPWLAYAQSLTKKPMKGMLTGPVTILCWSFVHDDLEREEVCRQLALALLHRNNSSKGAIQGEPESGHHQPVHRLSDYFYGNKPYFPDRSEYGVVKNTTRINRIGVNPVFWLGTDSVCAFHC